MQIKTELWVQAELRRITSLGLFAALMHKGDLERGGVLLKHSTLDGKASLFETAMSFEGQEGLRRIADSQPERDVDALIAKKRGWDTDLWVLEVEDVKNTYSAPMPILSF